MSNPMAPDQLKNFQHQSHSVALLTVIWMQEDRAYTDEKLNRKTQCKQGKEQGKYERKKIVDKPK